MYLPIDEMLTDLRTVLEAFAENPSHDGFAAIQHETSRIENVCFDALPEDENE